MALHKSDFSKLSINQLSQLTGTAYNTVKRRLAGLDPVDRDGRTLIYLTTDALARIYRQTESGRDRLDRLRADKVEHDLSLARGEVGNLEELGKVWLAMVAAFRSGMLSIPAKLAPTLASETDRAKVRKALEREIDEALNELSLHQIEVVDTGDSGNGSGAGRSDPGRDSAAA